MQTIKTAFVVVLLLTVLYGAHAVLTQPDARPPRGAAEAARLLPPELQLDEGTLDPGEVVDLTKPQSLSDRVGELSDDARPLVPPPSSPPSLGERATGGFAGVSRADESPAPLSSEPPRTAPAIPDLAPRASEFSVPSSDASSDDAPSSPPASSDLPAAGSFPPRSPSDAGLAGNSFVPPPSTSPSGAESDSAAAPPPNAAASPFAPRTISAGGFVPPAFAPAAAAAGEAATAAATTFAAPPDPKAVASSLNKEFSEGVRFDPKEALVSRGWKAAQESLKTSNWRQALATLSAMYEDPRLTHPERQRLLDSLDPLAARVVYSAEHLLEPAHEVRRGDNLMQLGEKYNVPWQLLRNINGIADPEFLVPGSKLKVMRGPFRAEIDTSSQEMTIYLQRLYAGRFPLNIGNEPAPRQGDFEVQRKELGRPFYASNGVVLPAGDVKNPYGRCWLDLGSDVSIHGSALQAGGPTSSGCISLSPRDADDVFAILSIGSRVSIR